MNWNSLFAPEGPGAYVCGSFGVCLVLIAAEVVMLRRRMHSTGAAFSNSALAKAHEADAEPASGPERRP